MNVEQFTEEVISRLIAEHEVPREKVEYLVPKIVTAFDTEHAITQDQLNDLIHGDGDVGVPDDLQRLFPLLNAICLSPYNDLDDSDEVEKMEEDEDDDEDDDDDDDVEEEEED